MRNLSSPLIAVLFLLLIPVIAKADTPLSVVINEIAWMGTQVSYNDEWIELYNNTDSQINLTGWFLKAADGTPKVNLTGVILAKSFYLLERTDDNTLPNIPADQIYTGALGNNGEKLELHDSSGNLIDLVDCSSGWFAGDNSTKQTMERKDSQLPGSDSSNWQTSQNPGGTPKAKNSPAIEFQPLQEPTQEPQLEPEPETQPEPEPEPIVEKPKPITYPSGIIINEILPSPTGPDETEEWIEIFNQNNFEVDLSNWQITEAIGSKPKTYTFSEGTKISSQGFLVLFRPTTKIILNNEGDTLKILQPNGNILDVATYEKAPRGQSYNRVDSDWAWSNVLTPGSVNIIPSPISETKEVESKKEEIKEPTPEKEIKEKGAERELAAIGSPAQIFQEKTWAGKQIQKTYLTLLIALAIALFSGIIILVVKIKLQRNKNLLE